MNNEIENDLSRQISLDYSRLYELDETDNVDNELKNARNIEEIAFDICATPKEIYFAQLADNLNKFNHAWSEKNAYDLDKAIISSLYKSDMDYMQIVECMTYSPSYRQLDVDGRWIMASTRVTKTINPLLTLPDIKFAKPLRQHQLSDFTPENTKQIYHSYLKAVLENSPEQNIKEADTKIVLAFKKLNLSNDAIKHYIEYSPQFLKFEPTNLQEKILLGEEKSIAINQFLNQIDNKIHTLTLHNEPSNNEEDQLMKSITSHLNELKDNVKNKKLDLKNYWKNINYFLKETMLQVNQAKLAVKVLDQWLNILEKSSQTFQIKMDQELKEMKITLTEIQKGEQYEARWRFIYDLTSQVTSYSEKMLNELKSRDNPLLKIPEMVAAKDINTIKITDSARSIYFSALKATLSGQPKIDINSANKAIIEFLTQKNFSSRKIIDCLHNAPNLQSMTAAKKIIHIYTLMKEPKNRTSEISR